MKNKNLKNALANFNKNVKASDKDLEILTPETETDIKGGDCGTFSCGTYTVQEIEDIIAQ